MPQSKILDFIEKWRIETKKSYDVWDLTWFYVYIKLLWSALLSWLDIESIKKELDKKIEADNVRIEEQRRLKYTLFMKVESPKTKFWNEYDYPDLCPKYYPNDTN